MLKFIRKVQICIAPSLFKKHFLPNSCRAFKHMFCTIHVFSISIKLDYVTSKSILCHSCTFFCSCFPNDPWMKYFRKTFGGIILISEAMYEIVISQCKPISNKIDNVVANVTFPIFLPKRLSGGHILLGISMICHLFCVTYKIPFSHAFFYC